MAHPLNSILVPALLAVPLLAYLRSIKHAPSRGRDVLLATTLAGLTVGIVVVVVVAVGGGEPRDVVDLWPWIPAATGAGFFVGVGGLMARTFGAWLYQDRDRDRPGRGAGEW